MVSEEQRVQSFVVSEKIYQTFANYARLNKQDENSFDKTIKLLHGYSSPPPYEAAKPEGGEEKPTAEGQEQAQEAAEPEKEVKKPDLPPHLIQFETLTGTQSVLR